MQLLEYRVKVPLVGFADYDALLSSALDSENTNIVTILQSGESDYANLPSRNNDKLHSGIKRTNKKYNIPLISSTPINVTSSFKNLTSRNSINSNISVTSKCSSIDNVDNIFCLPIQFLSSRTVVDLDLTNPEVWNFTLPSITSIISLPSELVIPTVAPVVFVYILFTIYPSTTEPVLDPSFLKAYIILLHKKIISILQEQ
jgi:hypothetical protein